ncbi:hypothetical protein BIV24_26490 [Streptomyces colonosanans]|uniref:Uncharacterized protein n=1 Tax=Streptomyces colonosanans TaxID=1428652 RepID=A0A1S2NY57_9ACTN|nr:hypothetical protein BIV24_26490 [Streptomyces colonosanans]
MESTVADVNLRRRGILCGHRRRCGDRAVWLVGVADRPCSQAFEETLEMRGRNRTGLPKHDPFR